MPFSRRGVFVRIVILASCIATAGELAAQPKTPVPDAQAQQTAKKAAGELFADRFTQAKTTAEKTALATDMMDAAGKVQAGSADQYVLLKIALDVAAGTGDAATALQAVERLLEQFDEPAAELIGDTLLTAARQATTSAQHKAVAEAALSIAGKLSDADQYETALRLCEAARSSAQRAKLFPLAKELTAQIEETKRQQLLSEDYRKALSVLEDKPTDPAANLAAGRHLCFVKGNWDRGVPMLALGSDAALKAAAIKDLRGADSADEQAAIGDAWWDLAEAKQGEERDTLRLRAGFWYRQAEPKLAEWSGGAEDQTATGRNREARPEIPTSPQAASSSQAPGPAIARRLTTGREAASDALGEAPESADRGTNSLGMRCALIPPGEFEMGSTQKRSAHLLPEARQQNAPGGISNAPAEAPKHRVKITKPFYLGLCEVTQEQYHTADGEQSQQFQGNPNRPVEKVNWSNAVEFLPQAERVAAGEGGWHGVSAAHGGRVGIRCRAGTTGAIRLLARATVSSVLRIRMGNRKRWSASACRTLRAYSHDGNEWEWLRELDDSELPDMRRSTCAMTVLGRRSDATLYEPQRDLGSSLRPQAPRTCGSDRRIGHLARMSRETGTANSFAV